MPDVIDSILFTVDKKRFQQMKGIVHVVSSCYSGEAIIRDSIFNVIRNYARKNSIPIEILRYPFHDDELWAFTFLKKGTVFICVNTNLSVCKQLFAAAHEFYHIFCYVEDTDTNTLRNGSMLQGKNEDAIVGNREEIEANAFAGLLLMPTGNVLKQLDVMDIDRARISIDEVLTMMDIFAMPYKACVLRLLECEVISSKRARELYCVEWETVRQRMKLTGKAIRWNLSGKGTELFGSLLDNYDFNAEHELLTESRIASDSDFIFSLKKRFQIEEDST